MNSARTRKTTKVLLLLALLLIAGGSPTSAEPLSAGALESADSGGGMSRLCRAAIWLVGNVPSSTGRGLGGALAWLGC